MKLERAACFARHRYRRGVAFGAWPSPAEGKRSSASPRAMGVPAARNYGQERRAGVLEFVTADVVRGFNAPDFKARADIIPGKVSRLRLVPDKTGNLVFLCDIFCGRRPRGNVRADPRCRLTRDIMMLAAIPYCCTTPIPYRCTSP